MFRKFLALFLSVLVVLASAQPAVKAEGDTYNITFIDIKIDFWGYDAINNMVKQGVISGYPDQTFRPENPISRQEFAGLISKTFNLDLTPPDEPTFGDVGPDDWSYQYVEAAQEFLTGYYPPSGNPFFDPEAKATREDVAVALVKAMGFVKDDLQDTSILESRFYDVGDISPRLREYVAIAVEQKLVSGYPDSTFRPQQQISRAEVAALLYKVIKSAASDGTTGPTLKVNVPEKTETDTIYISGSTAKAATVTINDEEVEVIDGKFKEGFLLEEEGEYEFVITAKTPGSKPVTVVKKVIFEMNGPVLKLDYLPDVVTTSSVTISGKITDKNDPDPQLFINDQPINHYGAFDKRFTLKDGENTFVFRAINEAGKTTVITRTITLKADGPELTIDEMPVSTDKQSLLITGRVQDENDSYPKLYLNDQLISEYGSFSKTITLQEGENVLVFKAVNKLGKSTTITKMVTMTSGAPVLKIDEMSEATTSESVRITGTVKDLNDSYPKVYLNDELLSEYGSFSKQLQLKEGENVLVFKAVNNLGKTVTITKKILFVPEPPTLSIDYLPATMTQAQVTITGRATDKNDSYPKVYLNDQLITDYGSFNKYQSLVEGENILVFKAINKFGKETVVTKTVTYTKPE